MARWRAARGLTFLAAAGLLNIGKTAWIRWEKGYVHPNAGWRVRIELLLRDGPEASSVAGQCRAYRHALALTQVEAAERCGFSRRSWQRWEAGECQPTIKDTRQLWRRLDKEMAPFRQHELDAVVLPAEVEDAPRCYLADCENVLTETRITVGWLRDSPAGSRSHCQVELCGWGCVERFASIEQAGIRE